MDMYWTAFCNSVDFWWWNKQWKTETKIKYRLSQHITWFSLIKSILNVNICKLLRVAPNWRGKTHTHNGAKSERTFNLNSGQQQGTKQFYSICHFIRSIHCLLMTFHALTHDVNQKLQRPLSMNRGGGGGDDEHCGKKETATSGIPGCRVRCLVK